MAEFCKECMLQMDKSLRPNNIVETEEPDICESCGEFGPVVEYIK